MEKISVIMPVYNGQTTLAETLKSLFEQAKHFQELIIINDASTDSSAEIIKDFIYKNRNCKLISNEHNSGLAKSYNKGIRKAQGDLIVTMHQDITLRKDSLLRLVAPFADKKVIAAGHADIHPPELWKKYNFWQKCFFARFLERNAIGINGQFDAFRKNALEKVGLFDEISFRTAGEDGDIVYKLKKIGKVADSDAKIVHLHKIDPGFSWRDIVRKQKQYSEAQGTLLSLGRIEGLGNILKTFFREALILPLLIPYFNLISLFLIMIYSFKYTGRVYLEEYRDPRILLLPFFNIYLLFVSLIYSTKGFFYGKQKI
jgi:glycosyltransferase involved in cell wall biosynthesis